MILNYFLIGLYIALWAYHSIILISIILTWIPNALNTKAGSLIYEMSNWMLRPFRGWLIIGFLDLTPVIGILILQYVMRIFEQIIF